MTKTNWKILKSIYIPAVESALGRKATWQQLKRLINICRVIYEENEETPDGYCNEGYIKLALKWDE